MNPPRTIGIGHNGAPPDPPATLPRDAACCRCRHWKAPSEREVSDYRMFKIGVSKRRVKKPTGSCDRVLMRPGAITAFSATSAHHCCHNYEAKPVPAEPAKGQGFVTIWENGRVAWSGREGEEPAQYRQVELPL